MKKSKKLSETKIGSATTWLAWHSKAVFSTELFNRITEAMGYTPEDMQIGNITSRLRNLGEMGILASLRSEIEDWNFGIDEGANDYANI